MKDDDYFSEKQNRVYGVKKIYIPEYFNKKYTFDKFTKMFMKEEFILNFDETVNDNFLLDFSGKFKKIPKKRREFDGRVLTEQRIRLENIEEQFVDLFLDYINFLTIPTKEILEQFSQIKFEDEKTEEYSEDFSEETAKDYKKDKKTLEDVSVKEEEKIKNENLEELIPDLVDNFYLKCFEKKLILEKMGFKYKMKKNLQDQENKIKMNIKEIMHIKGLQILRDLNLEDKKIVILNNSYDKGYMEYGLNEVKTLE